MASASKPTHKLGVGWTRYHLECLVAWYDALPQEDGAEITPKDLMFLLKHSSYEWEYDVEKMVIRIQAQAPAVGWLAPQLEIKMSAFVTMTAPELMALVVREYPFLSHRRARELTHAVWAKKGTKASYAKIENELLKPTSIPPSSVEPGWKKFWQKYVPLICADLKMLFLSSNLFEAKTLPGGAAIPTGVETKKFVWTGGPNVQQVKKKTPAGNDGEDFFKIQPPKTWTINGLTLTSPKAYPTLAKIKSSFGVPNLFDCLPAPAVQKVFQAYEQPHRFYRNLKRIETMMNMANKFCSSDKNALHWLIAFHDVVYDPMAFPGENVKACVGRFEECWAQYVIAVSAQGGAYDFYRQAFVTILLGSDKCDAQTTCQEIANLVKVFPTKTGEDLMRMQFLCREFFDLSRAVFASLGQELTTYWAATRMDRSFAGDDEYKMGRLSYLYSVLEQHQIYTSSFGIDWEGRARSNLKFEIEVLENEEYADMDMSKLEMAKTQSTDYPLSASLDITVEEQPPSTLFGMDVVENPALDKSVMMVADAKKAKALAVAQLYGAGPKALSELFKATVPPGVLDEQAVKHAEAYLNEKIEPSPQAQLKDDVDYANIEKHLAGIQAQQLADHFDKDLLSQLSDPGTKLEISGSTSSTEWKETGSPWGPEKD